MKLFSVSEIAATKAYVLGRRATYKEFDPRLLLEQLIYLEDVEDMNVQFLKKPVLKREMAKFFKKEIKKVKFLKLL